MTRGGVDREPVEGEAVPDGAATPTDQIRRPRRIGGKTFATHATVFTESSRQFGRVLLRTDHATEPDLTPQETVRYIRDLYRFAKLKGRIDLMLVVLDKLAKPILKAHDQHPTLWGGELHRLGMSVTEVDSVSIEKPNSKVIRQVTGSGFPQFGKEQVVATITVPEEPQTGVLLRAGEIEDGLHAAFHGVLGFDEATIKTNTKVVTRMEVTDREGLFEEVNAGRVPKEALGLRVTRKIDTKPVPKERVKKARKQSDDASQEATS